MDTSDSDSSLGEETDHTETNVYLGYASKELIEDPISHLGGFPVCCASTFSSVSLTTKAGLARSYKNSLSIFCEMQSLQQRYVASPAAQWRFA